MRPKATVCFKWHLDVDLAIIDLSPGKWLFTDQDDVNLQGVWANYYFNATNTGVPHNVLRIDCHQTALAGQVGSQCQC